ncbi:MAG: hypothetical protein IIC74_11970, partial [Bacteroidetes bacterium]|nr:hypothetical protein [Bacteroidota bacterium]
MNYKNPIFKLFILLTVLFSFSNCDTEQIEILSNSVTIEEQDISGLTTIPIKESIEY